VKIIEVIADKGHMDTLTSIAEQQGIKDFWYGVPQENERQNLRMLVTPEQRQAVLDALQSVLATSESARIIIEPVEVCLPAASDESQESSKSKGSSSLSREELYNSIEKTARLDQNYLLLVCFSTIVAAIGLIEDNVAVVVAAMVIAPLLGPNLAFALGTALGDRVLIGKSLKTNIVGIGLALVLSIAIGMLWPVNFASAELIARTQVGFDSMALALASGAAAILSLTSGLSAILVGVMVAVALLPPTATMGLMIGNGEYTLAFGAGMLLAVNVVCLNLAAKIGFLLRGVRPRTWLEQKKARQSTALSILIWIISLAVLAAIILTQAEQLTP